MIPLTFCVPGWKHFIMRHFRDWCENRPDVTDEAGLRLRLSSQQTETQQKGFTLHVQVTSAGKHDKQANRKRFKGRVHFFPSP